MGITYFEEERVFQIQTPNTTYLCGIAGKDWLGHIYYGKRMGDHRAGFLTANRSFRGFRLHLKDLLGNVCSPAQILLSHRKAAGKTENARHWKFSAGMKY